MTSYTGKHLYYYHIPKLYGIIVGTEPSKNNVSMISVLIPSGQIVKTKIAYEHTIKHSWYIISDADKQFYRFILKP